MYAPQLSRFACTLFFAGLTGISVPVAAAPESAATNPERPGSSTTGVGSQFELTFWQSIAASQDPSQFEAYLAQYPNGTFSALARAKIAEFARRDSGASAAAAAVAPAPPAYAPPAAGAPDDDLVRTDAVPESAAVATVDPVLHPAPAPADPAAASTPCGPTVHSSAASEPGSDFHTTTPAP